MTLAHLAPLLAVWALAVIAPGPDFVAVLRTSAARGRAAGIAVGVGVVSGIAVWAVLAMAGLGVLLTRYAEVYTAVRVLGAAFLIVFGLRILWSAWRDRRASRAAVGEPIVADGEASGELTAQPGLGSSWRLGLATNLANPKAVAFFGALFASILPPGLTTTDRAWVVVAMLAMALAWFTALAWMASLGAVSAAYAKGRRAVDSVTGGILTALGIALLPR